MVLEKIKARLRKCKFCKNKNTHLIFEIVKIRVLVYFCENCGSIFNRRGKKKDFCEHNYRELTSYECSKKGIFHEGMFCHIYFCDKCEDITIQDSSG